MRYLPLVWAMLWRSRARTWLTFLSIVVAFLLFGLLQSVTDAFQLGVRLSGDDRLVVTYKQGLTKLLPVAYRGRIEAVDGVLAAGPIMFLGGSYQDPKNQVQVLAVDPAVLTRIDPRVILPDEQARAFGSRRTGAVAGRDLAEKFGWKVGDRIPIRSEVARKDGGQTWEFDLVGIYDLDPELTKLHVPTMNLLVQFDHYNEAVQWANLVVWYTVRVRDVAQASAVARAIDREFQNSEFETRTQSEADFQRGLVQRFGNVGKMMTAILGAVFFTLLLVCGNTMMESFRERTAELAVLKTVGFGDRRVALLIGVEALLLSLLGGVLGLLLARALAPVLTDLSNGTLVLHVGGSNLAVGLALALGVGLVSALAPVWRSARLTVVEALVQA